MARVRTEDLIGDALDWAVAKCEGVGLEHGLTDDERYSTNWAHGGPIIERARIDVMAKVNAGSDYDEWAAITGIGARMRRRYGPTPLIAAMRCYVASKLGAEVEISDELLRDA